jgi:hypothetical protein
MGQTSIPKGVGFAFLVGGCFAVVGHLVYIIISMIINDPTFPFTFPITLCVMGVIGCILFLADVMPKLDNLSGFGSMAPFSGLSGAFAAYYFGKKMETGDSSKALLNVISLLLRIVIGGCATAAVVAAVFFFAMPDATLAGITGTEIPWTQHYPQPNSFAEPLAFAGAFVVGGAACSVLQLIWMLIRCNPEFILFGAIVTGALLTPLGFMRICVEAASGGVGIMVPWAGEAVSIGVIALIQNGNPTEVFSLLSVFAFLTTIGLVTGIIKSAMAAKVPVDVPAADQESTG